MYRVLTTGHLLRGIDGTFIHPHPFDVTIVVVGVGGTGGYLAEYAVQRAYAARQLYAHAERPGWAARVYLFDPDTVEARNVARQNFDLGDVGRLKVDVIAGRLLRRFGRAGLRVSATATRFRRQHLAAILREGSAQTWVLGCVDGAAGRAELAASFTGDRDHLYGVARKPKPGLFYLDCGNGYTTGQIMLGNVATTAGLAGVFSRHAGTVAGLPLPTWYEPTLLAPAGGGAADERDAVGQLSCAMALELGFQDPGVNGVVAQVAANLFYRGLVGRLHVMGARIALDTSEVVPVWIEPSVIAERCGLPLAALFEPASAQEEVAAG